MIPYVVVFCWSLIFVELSRRTRSRTSSFILDVFALVPPILLAALRDESIGTDMNVYVVSTFDRSRGAENPGDLDETTIEILYLWLNIVCNKIAHSLPVLLFAVETLVIVPFYIGAKRLVKYANTTFVMFLFFMFFYNTSLNIVRQSIAMAFVFLSVSYLLKGKYLKHLLICLIAVGFHNSAILALLLTATYWIVNRYPIANHKKTYFLLFIIAVVCVTQIVVIVKFAIMSGLLPTKYIAYVTDDVFRAHVGFSATLTGILCFFYIRKTTKYAYAAGQGRLMDFFLILALLDIMFALTGVVTIYLSRFGLYETMISFVSVPFCYRLRRGHRTVIDRWIVPYYIVYWLCMYVYRGASETIPYVSTILGI